MKSRAPFTSRKSRRAFTLVEMMISLSITVLGIGMALSILIFTMKSLYRDNQRLATNASLRSFMAQISKETLDASFFYIFASYTKLDGAVDLAADPLVPALAIDYTGTEYDKYVAHGDCLVLVTKTSKYRTTDIRQLRVYYRLTTNQTTANAESPLRYYETADWGEGTSTTSNGHAVTNLATYLNAINLNATPTITGSRQVAQRTKGRAVPSPYSGYTAGDRYPIFSSEAPNADASNGYISINVEFINGSTGDNIVSSSSFNYTISPRR